MKKSVLTIALIALLMGGLFFLTGCGEKKEENKKNENTSTTSNETTGTTTGTETGATTGTTTATEFYVQNLLQSTTIKELYASPAGTDEWSANLLGGLELAPGTQAKIGIGASDGTTAWDLKAVDEEGTAVTFLSSDLSTIFANNGGAIALQINEEGTPVVTIAQ